MSLDKYILDDDGHPILEPDLFKWAAWLEAADRKLALDRFTAGTGMVTVSTVFLGLDHNFAAGLGPSYAPILYETMIFGGRHDGDTWRYSTREDALSGHRVAVDLAQRAHATQPPTKD